MAYLRTTTVQPRHHESAESFYVRMIPGVSGSTNRLRPVGSQRGPVLVERGTVRPSVLPLSHVRTWAASLLPQPHVEDRIAFLRLLVGDACVLLLGCWLPRVFASDWTVSAEFLAAYVALTTLLIFSEGLYHEAGNSFGMESVVRLSKSALLAAVMTSVVARHETPLRGIAVVLLASCCALLLWRWAERQVMRRKVRREIRRSLIVGTGPIARAIARGLVDPSSDTVVCGFLDDHDTPEMGALGRTSDLLWLARADFVDEVILAIPHNPTLAREIAEVARKNHLDVRAAIDFAVDPGPLSGCQRIGNIPVITVHREPTPRAALLAKRALDLVGASVGLILAAPIMAVVAAFIRWETRGSVIFAATRTGTKGEAFRCYKFRSMVEGADSQQGELRDANEREGPTFKLQDDPRVTRVGRIIRRYSLDELPQLWNVLRGEMSLVGPRPHPVEDVNRYEVQDYRRLDVRPGLTGLWQITARSSPSFELNMHLDLTYIENWSLMLDLRILLKTVRVLFAPEGC